MRDTLYHVNQQPFESEDNSTMFSDEPTRTFKQFEKIITDLMPDYDDIDLGKTSKQERTIEEERLQLWMLLTKREKFDMLFHQVCEHEAQIMGFLIEQEHGPVGPDSTLFSINYFDNQMDTAVN